MVLVDDGGQQTVTATEVVVDGRLVSLAGLFRDRGHGDRVGSFVREEDLGGVDDGLSGGSRHA